MYFQKRSYITSFDGEKIFTHSLCNSKSVKYNFIFPHGWGGDSNSLFFFAGLLLKKSPNSMCLLYDQRGHGFSSKKFSQANNLETILALDLQSIIDSLNNQKNIILVGHSMGAVAVQKYLQNDRCAKKVNKTILICSPFSIPSFLGKRKIWFGLLKKLKSNKNIKRTASQQKKFRNTRDFNLSRMISDIYYMGFLRWILVLGAIQGWKNNDLECLNNKNILHIVGSKDSVLDEKKQLKIILKLPKSNYCSVPGNHVCPASIPNIIIQKIVAFSRS